MIREMADAMVELGYRDAGYEYLVIDDCWSELQRDDSGRLVPDRRKFPNGMKAVSDYIHSRGLKFDVFLRCVPARDIPPALTTNLPTRRASPTGAWIS